MSCIEVTLQRVGSSFNIEREGTPSMSLDICPNGYLNLSRVLNGTRATLERVYSTLSLQRQLSGVVLTRVCDVAELPYLEIHPELIWVYPDIESDNDVYSNLDWIVQ